MSLMTKLRSFFKQPPKLLPSDPSSIFALKFFKAATIVVLDRRKTNERPMSVRQDEILLAAVI